MMKEITLFVRSDRSVMLNVPAEQCRGAAESEALWIERCWKKAQANVRDPVVPAGQAGREELPARALRDAWRMNPLTGKIEIDLAAARKLRAWQWARESGELRRFITAEMLPYATLMGDAAAKARLEAALARIDATLADLAARIGGMTIEELASHQPAWPNLKMDSPEARFRA